MNTLPLYTGEADLIIIISTFVDKETVDSYRSVPGRVYDPVTFAASSAFSSAFVSTTIPNPSLGRKVTSDEHPWMSPL